MKTNINRLWLLAEKLDSDKIIKKETAFIIKAPRKHSGLTIILDENRLNQAPALNNKRLGYENVNYVLYIYANSGNMQEAESLSNDIYDYLLKNPKIDEAHLKAIRPRSPEFISEYDNDKPVFIVEFEAIYITQGRVKDTGQSILNGLLNMSF